jgi:SlyX protein
MQTALEQIEIKIAYLERTTVELSDVVFRQHREIQALQAQVTVLQERLSAVQAQETPRDAEQERPPHY